MGNGSVTSARSQRLAATLRTMLQRGHGTSRLRFGHRARATVVFAVAAGLVSVLLAVIAYTTSRSYLTDQRDRSARDRAFINARALRDQLRRPDADPGAALADLAPEEGATSLVRVDGEWYSSSVALEADDLPRDALGEAEAGAAAWERYDLRGVPHLAVAVPIKAVDAIYAEIVPLHQLESTLETLGASLLIGAGATTLAGAALGFVAAGRLVRPLRRLAARAEAIAAGDTAQLGDIENDPELAPLVQSLKRLLDDTSRRVEQGTRFVSDVSHEIRAPLAALSAAVDVMKRRRAHLPERSAYALDLLEEEIDEFQRLVLDLLEMSKIDAGRAELLLEPTDCRALVASAVALVDADPAVTIADDVPSTALLDRRRIGQVLVNLLENARRYAGGATEVVVCRPDAHVLRFLVRDRGPGVPEEERSRIFDRFERGDHGQRGPSGSGLGLALVTEHTRLHGGRVWVEDANDGPGARFVVEVPLCVED